MVNYGDVISLGVGMMVVIALGYVCGKTNIITQKEGATINKFVFKLGMLPVIARGLASRKFSELNFWPVLVAALISLSLLLLMTPIFFMPFKDKLGQYCGMILPSIYINYVITGLPMFQTLWPGESSAGVAMMTLPNDLVTSTTYYLLCGVWKIQQENKAREERGEARQGFSMSVVYGVLLRLANSPILQGNVVGLLWAATSLPLPIYLAQILSLLGNIVLPICLFCCGLFLSTHSIVACHWTKFLVGVLFRHFLSPLVATLFCLLLKLDGTLSRQIVVMAAQPCASASFNIADSIGLGQGIASTMVFWTTVVSVPCIILWLYVFDQMELFM